MAVELVSADEAVAFDGFVARAKRPEVLQSWGWGDLKAMTGWVPHRLFVRDRGNVVGACSLLERRIPGIGVLCYVPRGPVLDWDDAEAVARTLEGLRAFARERRAIALKCDPPVPAHHRAVSQLLEHGFQRLETGPSFEGVQPLHVMHLSLAGKGESDLLAGMAPKTRYNIRLASRRGVRVREGTVADLPVFYALLTETARRDGFLVRSLPYFEAMWRTVLARGLGYLLMAEAGGEDLAAAIILQMGNTAWYLYGASSNHQRNRMAPYLVQWEAISRSLRSGCTLYDFRGVSGDLSPNNPLYGLYRFKQGFGAELVEYVGEWDLALRPISYWVMRRGLPRARRWMARARRRGVAPAAEGE